MSSTENILYHYCRTDTFMKILHNKTIRVSDCSKTNDYSETQWIATSMKNTIINAIVNDAEFNNIYNYDNNLIEKVSKQISTTIEAVFLKKTRFMFTFVSCFSEEGDLLSQWRGYADDGKGLSIGFNKDLLLTLDIGGYNYFFKKVIYDIETQSEYVKNQILDLVNAYKNIEDEIDIPSHLYDFLFDVCLRISTFRNDSPFFKNHAFSEEKEWRLIINNHLSNYNNEYKNGINEVGTIDENYSESAEFKSGFVRSPLQFMTSVDKLLPYFDISYEKIKNQLIRKVFLGPKSNITEMDIRLFLETEGFNSENIEIIKSKATYR